VSGRILLVEDHPTMREATRMILEGEGHEVDEAPDGHQALAKLHDERYDLVLLDLNIPGLPGPDLLAALRSDPATVGVHVVVVTATGEEGRAEAMRLGADGYFTKPFGPTELLATVARVLAANDPPAG
jgi:two-component system alkaline phosphatase synthesis response regulator PhoP